MANRKNKGVGQGVGGGAPHGNKNGLKLKDSDVRQRAYKAYCDWLAKGKSPRSFVFEEDNLSATGETIQSYMKDEVEFPPIKRKIAEAKGFGYWESITEGSAKGENNANTPSLQMVMRNKFGWDKESKSQETHKADVAQLAQGLRSEPIEETENSD